MFGRRFGSEPFLAANAGICGDGGAGYNLFASRRRITVLGIAG